MKTRFFHSAMQLSVAMAVLVAVPFTCIAAGQEQQTWNASDTRTILSKPQVGDLYAADLTRFSNFQFNDGRNGHPMPAAFGLLKVIRVDRDNLTVITEIAAWPNQQGARNDLYGDLSNVTWDENEEIPLKRKQLLDLLDDGGIIEAHRPAPR